MAFNTVEAISTRASPRYSDTLASTLAKYRQSLGHYRDVRIDYVRIIARSMGMTVTSPYV
jgi:hypothetical protein